MNEEEIIDERAKIAYEQQMNANQASMSYGQQQIVEQAGHQGTIKEQLDLEDEMLIIDHLLKGHVMTDMGTWKAPEDEDLEILSAYGINFVRQKIAWYLNKNTLLSYYDEEQIKTKMKNFSHALSMSVYLKYQKVFKYPSFERCKREFNEQIEDKKQRKAYAYELLGKKVSEEEVQEEVVKEMENRIEKEFNTITRRLMKEKYSEFVMMMRQIVDIVHSAYQRAFRGMERTSLRKNISVVENIGQTPMQQKKKGFLGMGGNR